MEGFFAHGTRGHVWIDNIRMSPSTPLEECTRKWHKPTHIMYLHRWDELYFFALCLTHRSSITVTVLSAYTS